VLRPIIKKKIKADSAMITDTAPKVSGTAAFTPPDNPKNICWLDLDWIESNEPEKKRFERSDVIFTAVSERKEYIDFKSDSDIRLFRMKKNTTKQPKM
jgi:hypothetical protein